MVENVSFEFDLNNIEITKFGVWIREEENLQAYLVRTGERTKTVISNMLHDTVELMGKRSRNESNKPLECYNPAEEYKGEIYLITEDRELDSKIRELYEAENLAENTSFIYELEKLFAYFAVFMDDKNRNLVGLKKARGFTNISNKSILGWVDGTLDITSQRTFPLDSNFDLIMDCKLTHILRPAAFESLADLQQVILNCVESNLTEIASDLPSIDFESVLNYSQTHLTAARKIASIKKRELRGISIDLLKKYCLIDEVTFEDKGNKISPVKGKEMGLLKALNRDLGEVELIPNQPEHYNIFSKKPL